MSNSIDTMTNSDFFFAVESFRIFFEKILTTFHDPPTIMIEEWLKYKHILTVKDATPSSIYCYSHALVLPHAEPDLFFKSKPSISRSNSKCQSL